MINSAAVYAYNVVQSSSPPPTKVCLPYSVHPLDPSGDGSEQATTQDPCSLGGCEVNDSRGQKGESHNNEHCLGKQLPIAISARISNFNQFQFKKKINKSCLWFWMSNFFTRGSTISSTWGQWKLSSVCINHRVPWKIKALCRQVCQS